jgi:hypothetical protein
MPLISLPQTTKHLFRIPTSRIPNPEEVVSIVVFDEVLFNTDTLNQAAIPNTEYRPAAKPTTPNTGYPGERSEPLGHLGLVGPLGRGGGLTITGGGSSKDVVG